MHWLAKVGSLLRFSPVAILLGVSSNLLGAVAGNSKSPPARSTEMA